MGEKEKRSILLLHLCAKIAEKCNLRKNRFISLIVLGHIHHDRGHMVVGAMGLQSGAESADCSCLAHPSLLLSSLLGPGMVLLPLG